MSLLPNIGRDTILSAIFHGAAAMVIIGFIRPDVGFISPDAIKLGLAIGVVDVVVDMWSPRANALIASYGL